MTCPDCKGTGKYQPFIGPEEPCLACQTTNPHTTISVEQWLPCECYTKWGLIEDLRRLVGTDAVVRVKNAKMEFEFQFNPKELRCGVPKVQDTLQCHFIYTENEITALENTLPNTPFERM